MLLLAKDTRIWIMGKFIGIFGPGLVPMYTMADAAACDVRNTALSSFVWS